MEVGARGAGATTAEASAGTTATATATGARAAPSLTAWSGDEAAGHGCKLRGNCAITSGAHVDKIGRIVAGLIIARIGEDCCVRFCIGGCVDKLTNGTDCGAIGAEET